MACSSAEKPGVSTLRFMPEHDASMGAAACPGAARARWELFKRSQDDKSQKDNGFTKHARLPLEQVDLDWLGQAVADELPLKQRVCKNFAPLAQIAVDDPAAAVEGWVALHVAGLTG